MISKGRNVSALFPDVVINVVCQGLELKKLVYMYLVHYAEFEPEASLLSINTFQKDLDNPNQLIRAQALHVMSGIRLKVIVPIITLAIKKCVQDSSPYVRKMAAHAITKAYRYAVVTLAQVARVCVRLASARLSLIVRLRLRTYVAWIPSVKTNWSIVSRFSWATTRRSFLVARSPPSRKSAPSAWTSSIRTTASCATCSPTPTSGARSTYSRS